jgi:hypothetical protein
MQVQLSALELGSSGTVQIMSTPVKLIDDFLSMLKRQHENQTFPLSMVANFEWFIHLVNILLGE